MLNVVLVEPEIPQNTGNIARTCAVTGSRLHLVQPMGFRIEDSKLKRAGLDYWHMLGVTTHPSLEEFVERHADDSLWLFTTKAKQLYTSVEYRDGDFLVFGKETAGLPRRILERFPERCVRIPMLDHPDARSLNLSNCVAIGVYEALRQCGKLDNTDI